MVIAALWRFFFFFCMIHTRRSSLRMNNVKCRDVRTNENIDVCVEIDVTYRRWALRTPFYVLCHVYVVRRRLFVGVDVMICVVRFARLTADGFSSSDHGDSVPYTILSYTSSLQCYTYTRRRGARLLTLTLKLRNNRYGRGKKKRNDVDGTQAIQGPTWRAETRND